MTSTPPPEQPPDRNPDQERILIIKALISTLFTEMAVTSVADLGPVADGFMHTSINATLFVSVGAIAWNWIKRGE